LTEKRPIVNDGFRKDLDHALMRDARTLQSIKSKLIAFALLATLVPSVGLGLLSFWGYQAVLNDNVSHELHMLAADASSELKVWFRERINELRTLSTAYTLSDGLSSETEQRPGSTRVGARTGLTFAPCSTSSIRSWNLR
jgi:hypothetical protein